MKGMPLRSDRILRYVSAFCPRCHDEHPERRLSDVRRLAGYLAEEADRVWLVRGCPEHGRIATMYDESAEVLAYLEQWTAPTKVHAPDSPGNFDPAPAGYLRGLGEMQTQHTCILLEDITQSCNLCCPNCFTSSAPTISTAVPVDRILENIDARLSRENGRIDVLMLSGGEPTVHPQFREILERVLERDIVRVLVNTNGISVANDDSLMQFLEANRTRVEVYLQFDGFRAETHRVHRGVDLRRVKWDPLESTCRHASLSIL